MFGCCEAAAQGRLLDMAAGQQRHKAFRGELEEICRDVPCELECPLSLPSFTDLCPVKTIFTKKHSPFQSRMIIGL